MIGLTRRSRTDTTNTTDTLRRNANTDTIYLVRKNINIFILHRPAAHNLLCHKAISPSPSCPTAATTSSHASPLLETHNAHPMPLRRTDPPSIHTLPHAQSTRRHKTVVAGHADIVVTIAADLTVKARKRGRNRVATEIARDCKGKRSNCE